MKGVSLREASPSEISASRGFVVGTAGSLFSLESRNVRFRASDTLVARMKRTLL